MYQSLNGTYPDGYDLLSDGSHHDQLPPRCDRHQPHANGRHPRRDRSNYLGFQNAVGGYVTAGALTPNATGSPERRRYRHRICADQRKAALGADGQPLAPTFNPYPSGRRRRPR